MGDHDLSAKGITASASGSGNWPPGRPALPQKVRPQLSPDFIAHHKKLRLSAVTADLICEQGLAAVTVDHIVSRARVGRMTFYEYFAGKAECVEWTSTETLRRLFESVEEAGSTAEPGRARREAGIGALLEGAAANPSLTELCLLHSPPLADSATSSRDAAVEALARLLDGGEPGAAEDPPSLTAELIAGGIISVITTRLGRGEAETLPALRDEFVDLSARSLTGTSQMAST